MIKQSNLDAILGLSKEDRLELLEVLSESLVENLPPLSEAQRKLLADRLARHRADPRRGSSLDEVLARLRDRK